jgi:hypothetical protein
MTVQTSAKLAIGLSLFVSLFLPIGANLDHFRSQDLELVPSNFWPPIHNEQNSSLGLGFALGCTFCGNNEVFLNEPPPDDIYYMPPPPLPPGFIISDINGLNKPQNGDQCNFCSAFHNEGEQLPNADASNRSFDNRLVVSLIVFTSIGAVLCLYLIGTRKSRIIASLTQTTIFKSSPTANVSHQIDKNNTSNNSFANSGVHLSDPCYLQTNRDKNLTNPIISDHAPHKKTAIPSKYWAQQGSIINRTIRRVPNEYEVPSSQTNSTGTSSAVYADMNNEQNNQRFFSPYNLHTYAEVREVLDPNEHFHTSSNSSAMLSESNYDNNAVYPHNTGPGCLINNAAVVNNVHQGSVQMSDFNSMRTNAANQSMSYSSHTVAHPVNAHQHHHQQHHQLINHQPPKMHHSSHQQQHIAQPIYEQPPPQRAQVIITSNNQGVNPTLLNYRDRVHNVI